MNVYIGGTKDYSAMRGPCPDGFHIPLASEWSAVISAGIALGAWTSSNSSGVKTYLKIPIGGYRWRTNGATNEKGSTGIYWCSTFSNGGGNSLNLQSNLVDVGSWHSSVGASIRAFKDEVVIPDSSWTVLKQGTGTAGIYHNSTLGLISISSDGETWYTIADKNIGATTVYNDGNTLSSSNCGNTFQWGNNYKFSWDGSVTTSSTKVNASAYGPGNYYSSSTFILVSGTPSNWDSSDNNNLRGGVTGIVSPAELQNDYVGEYNIQTFDFQNDGALGWTDAPLGYGNCSIVSGQGWQITKSSGSQDKQGGIVPPQSVYKGTLKKYKIWFYKNQGAASGICNGTQSYIVEYGRSNTLRVNNNGTTTTIATITLTGEILMEIIFEDNGHITINLTNNGTTNTYDGGAVASTFQDLWTNKNLGIMLGEWVQTQGSSSKIYVRKVEIESA